MLSIILHMFMISVSLATIGFLVKYCAKHDDCFIGVFAALVILIQSIIFCSYDAIRYVDVEKELRSNYNLTLDDMKYIDEGKIFKYDDGYYIRTSGDKVLRINSYYINNVYDSERKEREQQGGDTK